MKKVLLVGVLGLGLVLGGCATTSGLNAKTGVSGFDGKKHVRIEPHGAACTSMICPAIGAIWIEDAPNLVGLNFEVVNDIRSINSAELNIDGEIIKLTNTNLTNFNTNIGVSSAKIYTTDFATVDKIINSKRTWVRLGTSKGYVEAAIIDSSKDSKAFHALKRFKSQVEITQKN
ncbi:hypothetical protein BEN74_03925 [Acinetobacter sp. WCHAc010034]|uniref:hypothetical protein n=1 Tax=Acinetobacter sp. WCHAc010034 TaxID=1879049 RepID=UPI00083B0463|nr:hypothetical protein [Acinetobacter sp. WCHAc010034]AYA02099.1 hypothetical protein BEN74_03925 [Acinetobacter sp. WCHAc010034]